MSNDEIRRGILQRGFFGSSIANVPPGWSLTYHGDYSKLSPVEQLRINETLYHSLRPSDFDDETHASGTIDRAGTYARGMRASFVLDGVSLRVSVALT
jgi:hypothetical protein